MITNYTTLQTSLEAWLNRGDMASILPEFIALAEAKANDELRHPRQIVRATLSIGNPTTALPADCLETKSVEMLSDPGYELDFLSAQQVRDKLGYYGTTGQPKYYTLEGHAVRFIPEPDSSYEGSLTYYQTIPSLSESVSENWLITAHPSLYLDGALAEAFAYLKDDERSSHYSARFDAGLAKIGLAGERASYGSGALRIRARVLE